VASARRNGLLFDEVPTLYERYRPGYPDEAVDWLLAGAAIRTPRSVRLLEVGPGTGQLTLPLARRGFAITALEPGPRMRAFLRRKLAAYPDVRVLESRFEDADLPASSFDFVVSATAFHWVDPEVRYGLAARVLTVDGCLGLLRHDHVAGPHNGGYYDRANEVYRRLAPEVGPPYVPPPESEVRGFRAEMADSGLFEVVAERRFAWDQLYTSSTLIGLLRTHSDHRALPRRRRAALVREIRAIVDEDLAGSFVDRYVTTVCVGRRIG